MEIVVHCGSDLVTDTLLGWQLVPQTAMLETVKILSGLSKQIRVNLVNSPTC